MEVEEGEEEEEEEEVLGCVGERDGESLSVILSPVSPTLSTAAFTFLPRASCAQELHRFLLHNVLVGPTDEGHAAFLFICI